MHYKNGVMPYGDKHYGTGILEQPAVFKQAMEIIEGNS